MDKQEKQLRKWIKECQHELAIAQAAGPGGSKRVVHFYDGMIHAYQNALVLTANPLVFCDVVLGEAK